MASEEDAAATTPSSAKFPHSYSSQGTGDAVSLNESTEPKQRSAKLLLVNVIMLDNTNITLHVQHKALGQALFDLVCKHMSLLEVDYFGLEYEDSTGNQYWLDCEKPMNRQLDLSLENCAMKFGVKFYTPDPAQLEEEYTRYIFCLQIRKDLSSGMLQCNDNTAALMASYMVQADCGDYIPEDYPDHTYLSFYKFVPHQDSEMERRIMENHKKHFGQNPGEADLNLLETVRRCELYGIRMHPAKDHEGVPLNLAIAHMGVLVFQNYTKINTFSWAKIRKLSFKRKRFLIKLHPEGYASPNVVESASSCQGYYKDTVEFFFEGRNECKNFWKKCVEHHGFFRCSMVKKLPRQKTRVLSRGSSFRYSGRTQKQVVDFVRDNFVKRQSFTRSQSFRYSKSVNSSISKVGASKSAQPLLPVGDQTVGTPASQSCGSMVLNDSGSTEALASPTQERAEIHSDDQASGEYKLSPMASPMLNSDRRQGQDEKVQPIMNGGIAETQTEAGRNEVPDSPPVKLSPSPQMQWSPVASHLSHVSTDEIISPVSQKSAVKETLPEEAEVDMRRKDINCMQTTVSVNTEHTLTAISEADENDRAIGNNNRKTMSQNMVQRYPTDKAYYIAKEILTTERTYNKDLEVIIKWFKEEADKQLIMSNPLVDTIVLLVDPIYEFHSSFLHDIEQRLAVWEGRSNAHLKGNYQRIGDILLNNMSVLDLYKNYLDNFTSILEQLDQCYRNNKKFEEFYKNFEGQKACYLPFNSFILKPVHRLIHYKLLLEKLILHYSVDHPDSSDCQTALNKLKDVTINMAENMKAAENFVKLVELQRDIVGVDNLSYSGKEFIREGCLQKLSKKGFQQRMFFLFSDVLIYANRTATHNLQFKVHGQVPLHGIAIETSPSRTNASNCFAIYSNNKQLVVAASSSDEKEKWVEDLERASQFIKESKIDKFAFSNMRSCSSSDEVLDKSEFPNEEEIQSPNRPTDKPAQQRSNTTVHVCWHRNTSVSIKDHSRAIENQLSGYLLRKFKNSNGWQKLWVVFTNFCLYFYKSSEDDFPLASLPLLGYTISTPTEQDNIIKEYVFKLQFKNHVYFFRAESEYCYERWMEVICCATQHSGRHRLFSRTESVSEY